MSNARKIAAPKFVTWIASVWRVGGMGTVCGGGEIGHPVSGASSDEWSRNLATIVAGSAIRVDI